jgi:hypothetical protein
MNILLKLAENGFGTSLAIPKRNRSLKKNATAARQIHLIVRGNGKHLKISRTTFLCSNPSWTCPEEATATEG